MRNKLIAGALFSTLVSLGCYAGEPVTINVTGNIISAPCTFDTSASTLNIDLGEKGISDLASAGAEMPYKVFSLAMKGCPAGTTKVTATFTGTDDTSSTVGNGFKNTGTATNMVVQIKDNTSSDWTSSFKSGDSMTVNVNTSDNTAKFDLATRAYTPTGSVNPGTINTSIVANFTYQ
ncbi:fimbrial protein [Cronobacter turicensis]|uniref:fimbrial protein n=1 Tax=Cronobacter turicensis TaxID=413502 RepID=UPI0024AEB829|nr:fimbrial protein [Cronobacter turicensis]MDI7419434.1 fimbrial protein [Cronobacter turicensis]MDI7498304.1 fimbrial protein [Cronobacter turicensis]